MEDADLTGSGDIDWEKLAGARLYRTMRMLGDNTNIFYTNTVCVVLEPLRVLHKQFMWIGMATLRPAGNLF